MNCQGSEGQLTHCDSGLPNRECSYAHVGCTRIESMFMCNIKIAIGNWLIMKN